jgi:hypothetical protein
MKAKAMEEMPVTATQAPPKDLLGATRPPSNDPHLQWKGRVAQTRPRRASTLATKRRVGRDRPRRITAAGPE